MSTEKSIRGTNTVPLWDFINNTYDEQTRERIYEGFSEQTRQALQSMTPDAWYPLRVISDLNHGIFTARGNPELGYQDMVKAGEAVGEYGVGTFMRLLIKLMTPEMLAKKWPTIWKKSHNFGRMDAEVNPNNSRHLTLTLSEVGDYLHIGPMAVGFLSYALRAMGREEARVAERDLDYSRTSADQYTLDLTW